MALTEQQRPEDAARIAELMGMHPALLQPEAIELRGEVERLAAELAEVRKRDADREAYAAGLHQMLGAIDGVLSVVTLAKEAKLDTLTDDPWGYVERILTGRARPARELLDMASMGRTAAMLRRSERRADKAEAERDRLTGQAKAAGQLITEMVGMVGGPPVRHYASRLREALGLPDPDPCRCYACKKVGGEPNAG